MTTLTRRQHLKNNLALPIGERVSFEDAAFAQMKNSLWAQIQSEVEEVRSKQRAIERD